MNFRYKGKKGEEAMDCFLAAMHRHRRTIEVHRYSVRDGALRYIMYRLVRLGWASILFYGGRHAFYQTTRVVDPHKLTVESIRNNYRAMMESNNAKANMGFVHPRVQLSKHTSNESV